MSTNISDLISQSEAARLRGCSRQAVAKLVKQGRLQGFVVAGRVLVSRDEVLNYREKAPGRPKHTTG
ncbi:MAG: helix-turn-helix domain-containing protein [Acidiferrobacter thiooxydans]|jgi:excisionase family DNA binding protein